MKQDRELNIYVYLLFLLIEFVSLHFYIAIKLRLQYSNMLQVKLSFYFIEVVLNLNAIDAQPQMGIFAAYRSKISTHHIKVNNKCNQGF